jgi:hypothetical protein
MPDSPSKFLARISKLSDAVGVHRAVTARLVQHRYGVSAKQAQQHGMFVARTMLTDTAGATRLHRVTFLCATTGIANAQSATLRHYAGLVALHDHVGASLTSWRVTSVAEGYQIPDAVWSHEAGLVAVEYDAGEYSRKRLFEKARNFALHYTYQIWGTASEARVGVIERVLTTLGVPGKVYFIPWR